MRGSILLAIRYALFAAIALCVNLGTQMLVVAALAGRVGIACSVIAGTGTGLAVKYILDQRYIFRFVPKNLAHQGRLFLTYSALGLATTLLFWGTEFAFACSFRAAGMRYLGGALGLLLGYLIKYQLDKRYVFDSKRPSPVLP